MRACVRACVHCVRACVCALCGTQTVASDALSATAAATGSAAPMSLRDANFYRGKLAACRYFYRLEVPHVHVRGALLESLDTTVLDVDPAWL